MKLLVLRHGVAEDAEGFIRAGGHDAERALTDEGLRRMRKVANRLRSQLDRLDRIVSSPYRRALETAEVLAAAFGGPTPERIDGMTPADDPAELLAWLGEQSADACIAVVGHEPHLGRLIGLLLGAQSAPSPVRLRKGGSALIEFNGSATAGGGVLQWLLTSAQMRALRD